MNRGTWIAASLMLAAAVFYATCFFIPGMRDVAESQSQLKTKLVYILDAQKTHRAAEHAQRNLGGTRDYCEEQGKQVLTQAELPLFYGQISQITKAHDLQTPKFEPKPPVHYESLNKISIGLGLSGSFHDIQDCLHDLEALPARIWIDELQIRGPRENGKPVECDMTLVVFVDNPEKTD